MADKHTSETLTGGPKQGKRNEMNRVSNVGTTAYGGTSNAAGLTRHKLGRRDKDDRMNSMVEDTQNKQSDRNPTLTRGEGTHEAMSSADSGTHDTTTGPGEARRERRGDIYDPDQPDTDTNPRTSQ